MGHKVRCAMPENEEVRVFILLVDGPYVYLIRCFGVKYRRMFLRVVLYFDEPTGRLKIQTTYAACNPCLACFFSYSVPSKSFVQGGSTLGFKSLTY